MQEQSSNHLAFIGEREYFTVAHDNHEVYWAPIASPFEWRGSFRYRQGARFYCTWQAWQVHGEVMARKRG
jgi:hypothetical protein